MKVVTSYQCELCDSTYETAEEARACEALGLPEPMPFLSWDREIPCFGENGVEWAKIEAVYLAKPSHWHEWWLAVSPKVYPSHNLQSHLVPAEAFDPRKGYDAFRYRCTPKDRQTWLDAMGAYGFRREECSPYLLGHIEPPVSPPRSVPSAR